MIVKLGSVISEYSVRNKQDEDIPVYSVTNEQGFCTGYFSKDVSSKDRTNYKVVPYGYFAYNPSRINVGSVDWQHCEERVIVSPLYVVFKVEDSIDQRYLLHFLKSDVALTMIKAHASGSVRDNLKLSTLQEFSINLQSIEEQRRVADVLDKVDGLLDLCKQEIKALDDLVKSRFIELFGDPVDNEMQWPTKSLEEACRVIVDCPHSTPNYTSQNTGFMCIRTSIVKKNYIIWDDIEFISEEEYNKRIQRKKPEKGDVIYTREGAILGIAAVIDKECNVALGQRAMLLSPDANQCNSIFLCNAMNCDSFLANALKGQSGSASPHINVGDIKAFKMIMPPIKLQQQFAAFVAQVDKSKLAVQQGLQELETLKKSLMQQYFG